MILFIPVGRLASEPASRETSTGRTYCTFSFAVDTGVKDANDQKITDFFNVTAWGKTGETVMKNLNKGDACSITGRFCARPYEGQGGTPRVSLDINASEVDFFPGGKRRQDDAPAQEKEQPRRRRQPSEPTPSDDDELPF